MKPQSKKLQKTLLALMVLASMHAFADDVKSNKKPTKLPEVQLAELKFVADKTFTTAGAVSEADEDKIARTAGGLDSVVRALPGSFTFMDDRQGTLKVNVRGMTGFGRVNTMIDGVPQTNFGVTATSEEGGNFHQNQANEPTTSSFGASIDSNFLVGVDVNRGGQGGSSGVNALMGSANFRTIGVNDVLLDGKNVGVRGKYTYGNNKLGHNGMLAVAGRETVGGNKLGAMLAISGANKNSDYKRGDGKLASSNAYNPARIQKPRSYLAKMEYDGDDQQVLISNRAYNTNVGGRELTSNSYGVEYYYQPNSNLINAKVLANTTKNVQKLNKNAKYFLLENARTQNRSNYIDVSNTSLFNFNQAQLKTQYGISVQSNDYKRQATAVDKDNYEYTTFAPSGKQKISSVYINNTLSKNIFDVDLSLSRVKTNFSGYKPACDTGVPCFPKGEAIVQKTDYTTNGKVQLSAKINDGFMPFVSYAKTSRMPNIQEVFFNNEGGGSMNPFLRPEAAKTYELGFNSFKQGVFNHNDTLGFKALYFNSKIKDYIHVQSFYLKEDGSGLTDDINDDVKGGFNAQIAVNAKQPVTSKGIELQANYDAGNYFANLSYTKQTSDQPVNINSGHHDFGFTGGAMDKLPEKYWTLELGSRFLDNKLQAGAILRSYGKNIRIRPDYLDFEKQERLQQMPNNPTITDLFARYEINKNATLRFGVENAFDKLYIHPSNSKNNNYAQYDDDGNTIFTNYARGRTFTVGADFKF
ncbi:putative outer membrane colicin Js receptor [Moraxella macacae 0408225]|uniref:Putative outer membrane colicin Js receptor n=1 Tax=Moraxella macacae 0408225 TaxID=1230338 RepID=L2F9C0_9GAMM|nr:TonB-dependent receptor [Moraxella macacae]ELA09659.1 putative outer membrane colicin Js receptor [Moraxella macacae 0408225]